MWVGRNDDDTSVDIIFFSLAPETFKCVILQSGFHSNGKPYLEDKV